MEACGKNINCGILSNALDQLFRKSFVTKTERAWDSIPDFIGSHKP
jgi:hypothetical protein